MAQPRPFSTTAVPARSETARPGSSMPAIIVADVSAWCRIAGGAANSAGKLAKPHSSENLGMAGAKSAAGSASIAAGWLQASPPLLHRHRWHRRSLDTLSSGARSPGHASTAAMRQSAKSRAVSDTSNALVDRGIARKSMHGNRYRFAHHRRWPLRFGRGRICQAFKARASLGRNPDGVLEGEHAERYVPARRRIS